MTGAGRAVARLAQLSAEHVGSRVVVRRALPSGGFSDVLGTLVAWDEDEIAVRRHDETVVRVPRDEVAGGKPVPPRAPRRRGGPGIEEMASLERAAARGWRALEEERLGDWLLRAAGGFTGRANSALPVGDPGLPPAAALDAVVGWYAARGLPPRVQLPLPLAQELEDLLVTRGWTSPERNLVMTAPVADVLAAADGSGAVVLEEPDEAWLRRYRYRGQPLPPVARDVLLAGDEVRFLRLGEAAVARGAVSRDPLHPERCWVGVTAVDVDPAARRQGLGRRITAAVVAWGADRGAARAYLQVTEANTAAIALYERLGFAVHHAYRYRTAPA